MISAHHMLRLSAILDGLLRVTAELITNRKRLEIIDC